MKQTLSYKISLTVSMLIFGTIGIFVNYIPLPSGFIAFARGSIGALCLFIFAIITKTEISAKSIKQNLLILCLSGGAIGFNWIFLFEAYRHTTVATATLCYYMAPVFVMLASPLVLGEKLSPRKLFCIALSLVGMVCVSGVVGGKMPTLDELIGILFGLAAAILYATVILLNKRLKDITPHNRTMLQLAFAAVVVLPYTLLAEELSPSDFSVSSLVLLLIVGIIHTGVVYLLYFGSMRGISAQTVAIFSYIDPAVAIILSAVILKQGLNAVSAVGAVLILCGTLISELPEKTK